MTAEAEGTTEQAPNLFQLTSSISGQAGTSTGS